MNAFNIHFTNMRNLTLGFIGLGLIGGSIAKAVRRVYPEFTIIAYNRSEKSRVQALEDKTADIVTDKVDSVFNTCDYIFLCTPVEHNVMYLNLLKNIISDSCIITDVGSVKSNIHKAVETENLCKNFIGGHPMAGSEKTGYANSNSYLLENAYYVLTPTTKSPSESVDELCNLIENIGAIPVVLDYNEHDYSVAAISHVPHLIAANLVKMVKESDSPNETMKLLAAGGFKDITRIASSSPDMWQQICSTNNTNIIKLINKYIDGLNNIKKSIESSNESYIFNLFTETSEYRNSFSNSSHGPLNKVYDVYCDLIDESGAIYTVAGILANENISIKNIGIIHNREFEDGVLRIEFYDELSSINAIDLLKKYNYKIYVR